jgi:TonB-dependent SusC/RagA subfamily outer membrane receptor
LLGSSAEQSPDACGLFCVRFQLPTIMKYSLLRVALPVWMLAGLAACSGRNSNQEPEPRITSEPVERNPGDPIVKRLQALDPGIMVTRTSDGGIAVQIRGASSFYSSNQPLYVVDDVPMQPGPGGSLAGINPHDIDSIKVLKNPSDIGIYGMRGANGVILIKLKKPGRRDG